LSFLTIFNRSQISQFGKIATLEITFFGGHFGGFEMGRAILLVEIFKNLVISDHAESIPILPIRKNN